MKKEKFDITGMSCSSCSANVEKVVSKLEGVQSVNVNLLSNNMVVEYDESKIENSKIISAVENAGYGAALSGIHSSNQEVSKTKNISQSSSFNSTQKVKEQEIKSMRNRLMISICFLIPLMYLAMHHMLLEWFGIPVPGVIQNTFHGTENAMVFVLTQFLLLIPIIYVNRKYYIVRF